jgi:hypothetical protein
MFIPILVVAAGYTLTSYGVILVRGYNISFKEWVNPVTPLTTWPAPGSVPSGSLWPPGTTAAAPAAAPAAA